MAYPSANNNGSTSNGNGSTTTDGGRSAVPENSAVGPSERALKHKIRLSKDWTPDEQSVLEELLTKYASDSKVMRFAKIAFKLRGKTMRDVALRSKWTTEKVEDQHVEPSSLATNNSSSGSINSDDHDISYEGSFWLLQRFSGESRQLLEENLQAMKQISANFSANFSASKVHENINLLSKVRNNIAVLLKESLDDMSETMKKMPPLPFKLNDKLANSIIPNTNVSKQRDLQIVDHEDQATINKYVKSIKLIFDSLDDGEVNSSPYDVAWVALIKDVKEPSNGPQFPSSLEWIVNHQLDDGSWGEPSLFLAYDRLLNTLACVIALTSWSIHPDKCEKGIKFLEDNINKLEDEKEEHETGGFEVVFSSLIEFAETLDIRVSIKDSPIVKKVFKRRDMKLERIPLDKFYKKPTILLYTLEGMKDLEWNKVLKLQAENGSMCYSPSATAFAFMHTKDQKCLTFLTNLVDKFQGGVPQGYPFDIYEQAWMVDRFQRLGIAHHFPSEIKECVDYLYRYWSGQGEGFARNCNLPDLDDTNMAFRVLRTAGYQVSCDVFRYFEKNGKFMCYPDQSSEAVTVMFNLYRASQVLFPGEKILNDVKKFSYSYLMEKRSKNELFDKYVIAKDLPGEVGYALDVPWYASLPRLETRYYLGQYGGEDELWIAKVLYRMGNISNNKYLELAKLDYNHCQAIHQQEWRNIKKWYAHLNIEEGVNTRLLWAYYEAAASIFEPERCNERVAWAKTTVIANIVTSFFARHQYSNTDIRMFVNEFTNAKRCERNGKPWSAMMNALHETINQISSNTKEAHGVDIYPHLHTIDDHTIGFGIESKMQELVQLVLCESPNDLDANSKKTFLTVAKTFYYRALFDPETINQHIGKVLFENVI
ncbi:hypothetical protein SSX86_022319 [Deinandra increscens subsp. villosa]|uniref:ent-kaurene synthase n=1 Tax=Deinandra increscens subsp. villosa TaxID=3103831 RepID=A0AAP0CM94_9ASTR